MKHIQYNYFSLFLDGLGFLPIGVGFPSARALPDEVTTRNWCTVSQSVNQSVGESPTAAEKSPV